MASSDRRRESHILTFFNCIGPNVCRTNYLVIYNVNSSASHYLWQADRNWYVTIKTWYIKTWKSPIYLYWSEFKNKECYINHINQLNWTQCQSSKCPTVFLFSSRGYLKCFAGIVCLSLSFKHRISSPKTRIQRGLYSSGSTVSF